MPPKMRLPKMKLPLCRSPRNRGRENNTEGVVTPAVPIVSASVRSGSKRKQPSVRVDESVRVEGSENGDKESEGLRDGDCEVDGDDDIEDVVCENIEGMFGDDLIEKIDGDVSDDDSGDEIWCEDKYPEPLSYSDDEEEVLEDESGGTRVVPDDPEDCLRLGRTFNCQEDFKLAVLRYSLKTRYNVRLYRSQSLKIGAKCVDGCSWKCYCAYDKRKQKMQIKIFDNEHTCVRTCWSKILKISRIAWLFTDRIRRNPKMTKKDMVAEIKREYNLDVSEDQCAKAKTKIMKDIKVIHEDNFARIWDYQAEIFRSNPGTTFEIETVPGATIGSLPRFFRLFICFKSQRDSWKESCRPIIGINGAFLKWDIKGHLLAATGRDGDNRIVPIAWAVVDIENDDNWEWFLKMLAVNLDLQDGSNVAMISDKQSGLVKAIKTITPAVEHRLCARHIMENWRRNSHDMDLQRLFWRIARSYTVREFEFNMHELQKYNPGAYDSLLKTNPQTWSRAYHRVGSCCNDILNNLSESFNRTIRLARRKPLLDMLEEIRRQCMVRNEKRFVVAGRLKARSKFTKRAHSEIEKMLAGSQFCVRWMARHNRHEVKLGNDCFTVDMTENTCGCRKWQMTGIPCVHAMSVINGNKLKVEDYVSPWYTAELWQQTYKDGIRPVQGILLWPRVNKIGVLPPPSKRGNPGRPSNHARRRGFNETATSSRLSRMHRVMTCSNCKEEGHNKLGCKNQRVESQPKKPRGRPRKVQEPQRSLFGQGRSLFGQQAQEQQVHGQQAQEQQIHGQQQQQDLPSEAHDEERNEAQAKEIQASQLSEERNEGQQIHGQHQQNEEQERFERTLRGWGCWFQSSS